MISLFGGNKNIELKLWKFPAGELGVKIVDPVEIQRFKNFGIRVDYQSSDDMINMLLLVDAIRNIEQYCHINLLMPYFPYARQDRCMVEGESHSLRVMADMIKSCNFTRIETWDAHSDVLAGMFPPGSLTIVPQEYFTDYNLKKFADDETCCLVSPDAGALKKIYKTAKILNLGVVEASKVRDVSNGDIVGCKIDPAIKNYETAIIIDDIADYGNTFLKLAEEIKKINSAVNLILHVTHGTFPSGVEMFRENFEHIFVANTMGALKRESLF